jgi:ribosome-associated heat shock protein Hsp15
MAEAAMRLDRFLWFARIVKSRSVAQGLATQGHFRIDGRAVDRSAAAVRVGNVLTFADHRGEVRAIRVETLPHRRGPPTEASACYIDLTNENASQEDSPD